MCIWFYAILYNEVIKMSIGENIRRIRKDKKLTQKELGEKLEGISQQQIGQWENGIKIPKLETIQKIATALEIHIGRAHV